MRYALLIVTLEIFALAPVGAFPLQVQSDVESLCLHSAGPKQVAFNVVGPNDTSLQAEIRDQTGGHVGVLRKVSEHLLVWDGRDEKGRFVAPGTYFVEILEDAYLWNGAVSVN